MLLSYNFIAKYISLKLFAAVLCHWAEPVISRARWCGLNNHRIQALFVLSFPVVLSIGIFLIPVVPDYSDHEIAIRAVDMIGRCYAGHQISAVAFALSVLSVSVISTFLRDNSYELPSFILPIMAVGAGLYAAGLGADGIAPLAVKSSGATPMLFFNGSGWLVTGTFIAATVLFGVGLISIVFHANQSRMVGGIWRYVLFISALIFVAAPAIPSGLGLYREALAAYGVFVPLGLTVWRAA